MKHLFLFPLFFLFLVSTLVLAAGEGTYGNETYGNFSYGVSSSASSSFSNSSVTTTANTSTIINATQGASSPNMTLEMITNSDTQGAVTLVKYDSQPPQVSTNTFASPLNKYVDIVVDDSIKNQLNYSIIKMYYTDAELSAANLQESTLRLSRWNGTDWVKFDPPTGGVDADNNFVWANTSSFSTWGIFGTTVPAPSGGGGTTSSSSSSGGGGSLPGAEENLYQTKPAPNPAPIPAPAPAPAIPAPATTPKPAVNVPAPTTPAAAPVAVPTGFAAFTGAVISGITKPSGIAAVVVSILVLTGLYFGYRRIYKKQ